MASPVIQSVSVRDGGNIGPATAAVLTGVTANNTLVLIVAQASHTAGVTATITVTDSSGNTWVNGVSRDAPDSTNFHESISLWYVLNASAGTHSVVVENTADTNDGYDIHLMEIPTASSFDAGSVSTTGNAGTTTATLSGYTPTASALVFSAIVVSDGTTNAGISDPPSGWTTQHVSQDGTAPGNFVPCQISLKNGATGAQSVTWNWTASHSYWAVMGGFLLAGTSVTLTPDSDVSAGAWTPSTGATLFGVLDETSVDDADYISTTSNSTAVVGLSDPAGTPSAGTRTLTYRLKGSAAKKVVVTYRGDGGTLHTFTHDPAPTALTTFNQTVTADAVSNWSTLQVGFEAADATAPPSPVTVYGAQGTAPSATGSATTIPAVYPSGITAGQLLVLTVSWGNSAGTAPTTPSGWGFQGTANNTTGTFGTDTGPRRVSVYAKIADGTETGTLNVTATGNNTGGASIIRLAHTNAGYDWAVAVSTGADSTAGTGVSVTGGSTIAFQAGDLMVISVGQLVDNSTQSAKSITATGITFGTLTNRASVAITTGSDMRHIVDTVPVSSGSGTVAPVYAYTASSATTQAAVVFLRVREVPPAEFARVTWAKLTVPSPPPAAFVNSPCFICM